MRIRHIGLALLVVLVTALPAWAADAEAGEEGGMPPFLKPDPAAIVTAIVTFVVLLLVLSKLAWKPILNGLQQREATIQKAVDDAQKANEEARALVADYESKLDHAKEEAQAIADEARRDAEEVRRRIEEDAKSQAEATTARALKEIDQAKHSAMDTILKDVTAIATEAASRILRKEITPETNAALVDEVVNDFVKGSGSRSQGGNA